MYVVVYEPWMFCSAGVCCSLLQVGWIGRQKRKAHGYATICLHLGNTQPGSCVMMPGDVRRSEGDAEYMLVSLRTRSVSGFLLRQRTKRERETRYSGCDGNSIV